MVMVEVRRMIRIWPQALLPSVITSVLYFVIFGRVIGHRIGQMNGYDYVTFIAPGLIMMNIITSAYGSTSSALFSAKMQHSVEEILVSPISHSTMLLGYMSAGIARGFVIGILVLIVSLIFAHIPVHSVLSIFFAALFSASIFSLLGVINAIYAKTFDDVSIIPTFVLTPLTYLGGVFYSIQLLPKFWQYVSLINPIVYIIDNFRYGFLGIQHTHIVYSYLCMILFAVILFGFTFYLLKKGVGLRS